MVGRSICRYNVPIAAFVLVRTDGYNNRHEGMLMPTVEYAHISFNANNVAIIAGTRIKVRLIVMDHIANEWDAAEIHRHHPHLTLGQIHSALSYYYDHKDEMDAEIADDLKEAERLMAEIDSLQDTTALKAKLKAARKRS